MNCELLERRFNESVPLLTERKGQVYMTTDDGEINISINFLPCLFNFFIDCGDVKKSGETVSGVYEIKPDHNWKANVFCDFVYGSQDWIVFQRRKDASVDFYRNWASYKNGFGDTSGNFWIGLDTLHRLAAPGRGAILRIDMKHRNSPTTQYYAKYSSFEVGDEASGYKLLSRGYSGDLDKTKKYANLYGLYRLDLVIFWMLKGKKGLAWFGHLNRIKDSSYADRKKPLQTDLKKSRPRGRPSKRWSDQLKHDTGLPLLTAEKNAHLSEKWRRCVEKNVAKLSRGCKKRKTFLQFTYFDKILHKSFGRYRAQAVADSCNMSYLNKLLLNFSSNSLKFPALPPQVLDLLNATALASGLDSLWRRNTMQIFAKLKGNTLKPGKDCSSIRSLHKKSKGRAGVHDNRRWGNKYCGDVKKSGETVSGVYEIKPDHNWKANVFCDFVYGSQDWIVFQRRIDASVDFYRNWASYKNGFGVTSGNFWIGLDTLHRLAAPGRGAILRIDMKHRNSPTTQYYAKYSSFEVGDEASGYKLLSRGYSGDLDKTEESTKEDYIDLIW
eukprot:gene1288-15674_t